MVQEELKVLEQVTKQWVLWRKNNNIQKNSCILACNLAHQLLVRLGVEHEVLPVGTTVFNRKGWEMFGTAVNQLPDDAWTVHCSSQTTGSGFGGHTVIHTENYFLDLTALQFSRPEHEIFIGETLIVPLEKMEVFERGSQPHAVHLAFRTNKFWTFPIGSGLYSYYLEKWNTIYRKSPDWNISAKELGIPSIIEEMQKGS
jgi:hypothetical protein